MTFFPRCDASPMSEPSQRRTVPRHGAARARRFRQSLSDFLEDVGILFRYAVGLDCYGRDEAKLPH